MKIKVGVSSCLLGQEVRYNGGHKHSKLCTDTLNSYFDFISECPEVAIGLGIPREPIRLTGDTSSPRATSTNDNKLDYTDELAQFGKQKAKQHDEICGYIFMKNSPSCGLFRVKVYGENGYPQPGGGRGIYAQEITNANPLLPVEESGRLQDAALRENFITRVFAYHNWQQLLAKGLSHKAIIDFHVTYKYCLMAHSPSDYTKLGQMVAGAGNSAPDELGQRYFTGLMAALTQVATRKTHTNVLSHLQGYLKKVLSSDEKQELVKIIEQYRVNQVPLIVPITLLKHHFANHPDPYISKQAYLQPYPEDLSLRNRI
jgi:uncharacterized protein YbgA (DUF1722 family)/uncharacterized protein YbbK (DUF523 family)